MKHVPNTKINKVVKLIGKIIIITHQYDPQTQGTPNLTGQIG
jgi:hypothetical protein